MDASHLEILQDQVPAERRQLLTTQLGQLPDVNFAENSFSAILASRVIHFLSGDDVELAVRKMASWLKPGGHLFLLVDTPYMPSWSSSVPVYEEKKRAGDKWPGFLPDFSLYLSHAADRVNHPQFMNPMDPDILARLCQEAGLSIVRQGFTGLQRGGPPVPGKEHAGCEAAKPA
jgi:SAM-dependent methyltransferase